MTVPTNAIYSALNKSHALSHVYLHPTSDDCIVGESYFCAEQDCYIHFNTWLLMLLSTCCVQVKHRKQKKGKIGNPGLLSPES